MNIFKMLGNLGNMSKIQKDIQAITEEMADKEYHASAGGGLVSAIATGGGRLVSVTIDPKLIQDNDKDLLEDLVVSAANAALMEAKRQSADAVQQKLAEKLDMPEMAQMLNQFMPKT